MPKLDGYSKYVSVSLSESDHKRFKSKCRYLGVSMQDVLSELAMVFTLTDDFNKFFNGEGN